MTHSPNIFIDFEYRDNRDPNALVLFTWFTDGESNFIDLRDGAGVQEMQKFFLHNSFAHFFAYNADAEIQCLLTLDIDVKHLNIYDVMVEFNMIRMTHPDYFAHRGSMSQAIKTLNLSHSHSANDKDDTRDLILGNTKYDQGQWIDIIEYGLSDVEILSPIMQVIHSIHKACRTSFSKEQALQRGEYVKAASVLHRKTKGFPVSSEAVEKIYHNRSEVKNLLCEKANEQYGELYCWNPLKKVYSFKEQAFEDVIVRLELADDWKKTATGRLSKEKDYLSAKCKEIPQLRLLKQTRDTLQALNSTDLRTLLQGDFIVPQSGYRTFAQVTGRTSPKPKEGFLLNLPPWLRHVIQPKGDQVFLGIDWSQQEIAIAAVLSGDEKLIAAYESGDIYSHLAVKAGAMSEEEQKVIKEDDYFSPLYKQASLTRQAFKAVQLGIGYGRTVDGLKEVLFSMFSGQFDDARVRAESMAEEIFDWHKGEFAVYWDWVRDNVADAQAYAHTKSVDGWCYFTDTNTKVTQLNNFPMQSNGASMMRKAVQFAYQDTELDVVCSLHDAVYINTTLENMVRDEELLGKAMDKASRFILGDRLLVRRDSSIYTAEHPYTDKRGTDMWNEINERIDNLPPDLIEF